MDPTAVSGSFIHGTSLLSRVNAGVPAWVSLSGYGIIFGSHRWLIRIKGREQKLNKSPRNDGDFTPSGIGNLNSLSKTSGVCGVSLGELGLIW